MSHFTVLVVGDNYEDELIPYQENNMGDCPEEFIEWFDMTQEVIESWNIEQGKQEYDNNIDVYADKYFGYNKNGDMYGYYENPNAKWDWYQLGGRWSGHLLLKNGEMVDTALMEDIDWESMGENKYTFAILKDGKWYERGEMGWFGIVSNENDNWEDHFDVIVNSICPSERVSVVDCHI